MAEARQRTIVYVDGFNLYYGALKDGPNRWLDLAALSSRLLKPSHKVVGIRYFTAKVQPRPDKPKQTQRQQAYLRALATISNLSIHFGHFLTRKAIRRLVRPSRSGPPNRLVWNTEEKGSDVNLASYLLIDGFRGRYDIAVVISNDSDLKTPIEFVRDELGKPVGVLNPHQNRSWALSPRQLPKGSFYKPIRPAASRLPNFRRRSRTQTARSTSQPAGRDPESARAARGRLRIPAAEANWGGMRSIASARTSPWIGAHSRSAILKLRACERPFQIFNPSADAV